MQPLGEMGKFKTVVVDPPWPLPMSGFSQRRVNSNGGPLRSELPYPTDSLETIAAYPLDQVLDKDALLFCWTINRFLPDTFSIVRGWGLQYAFTMAWVKSKGIQSPVSPCFNTEFVVVGRLGHPGYLDIRAFRTGNSWPRGEHSEKPEGFYDLLRRVTPGPRLDIFGRRRIAGFESWGNEAPEGPALPSHYQQVLMDV